MMVRFSDIINKRDDLGKNDSPIETEIDKKKLWLSNAELFRLKGKRTPSKLSDEPIPDHTGSEIISSLEKLLKRALDIHDRVRSAQGISPSPILTDIHHIIENKLIDGLYEYAVSTRFEYDEMLIHNVTKTFVSLKIGKGMGYDTRQLLELGLAAFLENVGMYKISDNILKKAENLDKDEIEVIKKHPEVSFQILSQMGKRYGWLADVALQVHERTDGSGYPKGLKGEEISELASIIGLVDTYVAMINERPYREKCVETDAVKFIIKETKKFFPVKILKIFLNQVSLFPVNTYIRLNNKSIGRVLSTNENQPLRPTIEILYDGQGNRPEKGTSIRLTDNPLLYITETIHDKDLP
jgi:HD-GYP domain-containing protein (c-di-GMP phosphodiesterase class II)